MHGLLVRALSHVPHHAAELFRPRAAVAEETIKADTANTVLYALDRAAFQHIIITTTNNKLRAYERVLQTVSLLDGAPSFRHCRQGAWARGRVTSAVDGAGVTQYDRARLADSVRPVAARAALPTARGLL